MYNDTKLERDDIMYKIPYGISNYKTLKEEEYYYVDKTMYLEKLEDIGRVLVYLRPGRFGKTLFTSMMNYYYDVNSKDLFNTLFKNTYVYDNPTKNKNNYYILKFDFSGMTTALKKIEDLEIEFKNKLVDGFDKFNNSYKTNFEADSKKSPNGMLLEFLSYFRSLNLDNKLYIIIDEYDNFTNAILEGQGDRFSSIVGNEGFLKGFYAVIKEYCSNSIVDRVFITGICPITLDSMTTGFNISTDLSRDIRFNSMIGLTHDEVKYLIKDINKDTQENIFSLMLNNYDGYLFNKKEKDRVFNATLVMYFLKNYYDFNEIPEQLLDNNIAFNYGKVENLLKLQNNNFYKEVIDIILKTGTIEGELKSKFNLSINFEKDDIISLLYYFGYLTIKEPSVGNNVIFSIPNYVMNELYTNYFLKILRDINIGIESSIIGDSLREIIYEGKIDKITKYVSNILKLSDNRIFMKFDEKYIQLLYFSLLIGNKEFFIYNEYPTNNGYVDLILLGNKEYCKYNIMIELKYLKLKEYRRNRKLLNIKREEAINQLNSYSMDERIDNTNLKKYIAIFIGHDLKLLESI